MLKLTKLAHWGSKALLAASLLHALDAKTASTAEELRARANAALTEQSLGPTRPPRLRESDNSPMLYRGEFGLLESGIQDFWQRWKNVPTMEYEFHSRFIRINGRDPNLLHPLNRWITESLTAIAFTARGWYLVNRGTTLRGDNPNSSTPKLNIEMMTLAHIRARADFEQAIRLDPSMIPAYTRLLEIAKFTPSLQIDRLATLNKITANQPNCLMPRKIYLDSLGPTWGGTVEAMKAYSDTLDAAAELNPLIWPLKGLAPWER